MPVKDIILKTAKKKAGTLSRARVRSVVAAVYRNTGVKAAASKQGSAGKVLVTTGTGKKSLLTK